MRRLFSIGEALIDFIPNVTNANLKDVQTFTKQIGGAPCNVACTVQKLGQQAYMITQLGNDAFGDSIIETISSIGVDVSKVYRTNANGTVVFDPNVRLPLWDNAEDLRQTIHAFLPLAHIVKVSDEELEFITGIHDENEAIQSLFTGNVTVVIYTKGADGAAVYLKNGINHYHSGYKVKPVDTTGAGDAFIGAVISRILATDVLNLTQLFENEGEEILAFSNRVAAIVTTKYGAINSLPTLQEVEQAF